MLVWARVYLNPPKQEQGKLHSDLFHRIARFSASVAKERYGVVASSFYLSLWFLVACRFRFLSRVSCAKHQILVYHTALRRDASSYSSKKISKNGGGLVSVVSPPLVRMQHPRASWSSAKHPDPCPAPSEPKPRQDQSSSSRCSINVNLKAPPSS